MYVPPAHNCTAGLARPPASRHPQRRRSELASVLKQTIEEDCLPLQNLRTGLVEPKLGRAVKFRKFLTPPGSWRPFHLEHIALQSAGVPVTFNGPYVNGLSTRLLCLAKRPRFSARAVTRLFREFPLCSGERGFTSGNQALWNRPRCKILVAPERTAGMAEQNLDTRLNSGTAKVLRSFCLMRSVSPARHAARLADCRLRCRWRKSFASGIAFRTRSGGTPPLRAISTPQCMWSNSLIE